MYSIKILERLQRLHFLIESECTGSPKELATKLDISERSVYHLVDHLRDFNACIGYDRSRKTYYYKEDFDLQIAVSISIRNNNERTEILGGSYLKKEPGI